MTLKHLITTWEILGMRNDDRWDPRDFGPLNFLAEDDGQFTIFLDTNEPPNPDDFSFLEDYRRSYREWVKKNRSIVRPTIEDIGDSSIVTPTIEKENQGSIGEYNKGKNWYYRFTYRVYRGKSKYKHKHIGPIDCPVAQKKALDVRVMLATGEAVEDILIFLGVRETSPTQRSLKNSR